MSTFCAVPLCRYFAFLLYGADSLKKRDQAKASRKNGSLSDKDQYTKDLMSDYLNAF